MHEAAAAFRDGVFIDGIEYFFSDFFSMNDRSVTKDFQVVRKRWLRKGDVFKYPIGVNIFMFFDDTQD